MKTMTEDVIRAYLMQNPTHGFATNADIAKAFRTGMAYVRLVRDHDCYDCEIPQAVRCATECERDDCDPYRFVCPHERGIYG